MFAGADAMAIAARYLSGALASALLIVLGTSPAQPGEPLSRRTQPLVVAMIDDVAFGRLPAVDAPSASPGLDLGIVNEQGIEGCPGYATVALPLHDGPPIPYPFVAPKD